MEEILRIFPEKLKQAIQIEIKERWPMLQEIRIRLDQPIELIFNDHIQWITYCKPTKQDSYYILNQISEFSLYRMEDELREGFITIEGGHRVGLAGRVNTLGGSVKSIQHITFFNVRVAKENIGSARSILPYIYQKNYYNTLFVGAPQTGKTTIIRDVARLIASGWKSVEAMKVGVIDERSELAAAIKGVPQHNLGLRTDVMDACPKAEGMMMMIRSMSPDVLIVDEIGGKQDVLALMEAINAGVIVFCTIHGQSLTELKKRPSLQPIFKQNVFQRIIILEKNQTPGHVQQILNHQEEIYYNAGCFLNEMDRSTSLHKHNNVDRI